MLLKHNLRNNTLSKFHNKAKVKYKGKSQLIFWHIIALVGIILKPQAIISLFKHVL